MTGVASYEVVGLIGGEEFELGKTRVIGLEGGFDVDGVMRGLDGRWGRRWRWDWKVHFLSLWDN